VALKCDRCGGDPACVAICPTGALRLAADGPAQPLHDQLAARRAQLNAALAERGAAPARRQP
jgi:Fe-S-cluster-containing hydrogenase component 2